MSSSQSTTPVNPISAMLTQPRGRFRIQSIFVKATAVVALCAAMVAATVTYFAHASQQEMLINRVIANAGTLAELTGHEIGGAIKFAKPAAVEMSTKTLTELTNGELIEVLILTLEGQPFYHYVGESHVGDQGAMQSLGSRLLAMVAALPQGSRLTNAEELLIDRDQFIFAHPTYFGNDAQIVGVIVMRFNKNIIIGKVQQDLKRIVIIAGLVFLVALVGASLLFRKLVSSPLTRVTHAVARVADGDYVTEITGTRSKDEIGDITRALEGFREDLAATVEITRTGMFKGSGFEGASAALVITDMNFDILYINDAAAEFLRSQFPAVVQGGEALTGKSVTALDPALRAMPGLTGRGLPQRIGFETGREMLEVSLNAVRDDQGRTTGYILEWRSVTQNRRNAAVLNAIDAGQLRAEISPKGFVEAANSHFAALFGQTEASVVGQDVKSRIRMLDAKEGELWTGLTAGTITTALLEVDLPGGEKARLEARFSAVTDNEGKPRGQLLLASDVTRQQRLTEEAESRRIESEVAQARVVDQLRAALSRLSEGDLTCTIATPFSEDYEQLRHDFNDAAERLRAAMADVVESSVAIRGEVGDISSAADDLSRRTEQQAATLEETAAALDQMTTSVKSTADVASTANTKVDEAKRNAETSGQVVREAVAAMGEIEQSSSKISRITSVIDEIAFQTNLLALNAGVEAARAGEAGRGFAVVASEVRDLAQRSSEAAREIAGLITASSDQVKRGVNLVAEAGRSLNGIQLAVGEIHGLVSEIATSAKEQSNGIAELNTAVKHLDQVTQQNAAMFEETSAASQSLNRAALTLADTTTRFVIGAATPARGPAAIASSRGAPQGGRSATVQSWGNPRPAAESATQSAASVRRGAPVRSGGKSNLAMQPDAADGWEDF